MTVREANKFGKPLDSREITQPLKNTKPPDITYISPLLLLLLLVGSDGSNKQTIPFLFLHPQTSIHSPSSHQSSISLPKKRILPLLYHKNQIPTHINHPTLVLTPPLSNLLISCICYSFLTKKYGL